MTDMVSAYQGLGSAVSIKRRYVQSSDRVFLQGEISHRAFLGPSSDYR